MKGIQLSDDPETAASTMGNDAIVTPQGTRQVPGRTCRHLATSNATFTDGYYFIDPNGGRVEDAVKVYCVMSSGQTCVQPKDYSKLLDLRHYSAEETEVNSGWLALATGILKMDYQMDASQLNYLKLLSRWASQNISLLCDGSAVVEGTDTKGQPVRPAVLYADNESEFHHRLGNINYHLVSDECKNAPHSGTTEVQVVRSPPSRLPVRDVQIPTVSGGSSVRVGIRLGQVCFS